MRFLAPLALIAFGLAFLLVVSSADVSENGGPDESAEQSENRDLGESARERRRQQRENREDREGESEDVYVIKKGDNLSTIAEETGVPVERLLELNPELDPQALTTGQEVRLTE